MALPVIDSTYTSNTGGSGTITIAEPGASGTSTDDVVLIFIASDNNNPASKIFDDATNKPTGFTLIAEHGIVGGNNQDCQGAAYYRVIDGTESWPITCTTNGGSGLIVQAVRLSSVDTSAVINQTGTVSEPNNTGSTLTLSGVTTTENDCTAFYFNSTDGADTLPHSPDGSWTEGNELGDGGGAAGTALSWGYLDLATAGASGNVTISYSATDGRGGFQFAVKGESATGTTVTATTENLVLSEQDATVSVSRTVIATTVNLTLTEISATVTVDKTITATTASLTLAEQAATVTVDKVITATTSNLVLAENPATILQSKTVTSTTVGLVLAEIDAAVTQGQTVTATTVNITLSEQDATILQSTTVTATTENLVLAEIDATVSQGRLITSTTVNLTLTEQNAAITVDKTVTVSTVNATVTPQSATVSQGQIVAATTVNVAVSAIDASVNAAKLIQATTSGLVLSENNAVILQDKTITATTATLTVSAVDANVVTKSTPDLVNDLIITSATPLYSINTGTELYSITSKTALYSVESA